MSLLIILIFLGIALLGMPLSLALGASAIAGLMASNVDFNLLPSRMMASVNAFPLMTIPFFILAGELMLKAGMMERLIDLSNTVVGRMRGGLGHVTVLAGMGLSTVSGAAVADASALGSTLMPSLKKHYGTGFSAALCAAAANLGPIIPPSGAMIVYAFMAGPTVSVGGLFMAGVVPGILLVIGMMSMCSYIAWKRNFPLTGAPFSFAAVFRELRRSIIIFLMPVVVIGGIVGGAFTATEGSAIAVVYALAIGFFVTRKLKLSDLPGALVHTAVTSAVVGAMIAFASVVTYMLTVALPSLQARNYPMPQSLGTLAAGGTLGILIPPSINMIVYGSLTENSIGKLFIAGIIPGLLLTGFFMLFVLVNSYFGGKVPREELPPMRERVRQLVHLIPPIVIFGIVMGSLYTGFATATESAALGVIVALFFAWRAKRLTWPMLENCFLQTARTTGMIMLILAAAFVLNLLISLSGVAETMTKSVTSLGLSATAMLLVLIVFYLILGMFMDVMSMLVATVPITYPIVVALGVDPIWFGIFIILMCELALITPPVGMNLFVVQGVRPDRGGIGEVIRGAFPYVIIMMAFTLLLMAFPGIVTWLPNQM